MKRSLLLSAFLFLSLSLAAQGFDPFDEDPLTSGKWELLDNLGASYVTEDGWWQVTCPQGLEFNHWVGFNDAVQLRRDDIPADFIMETRVDLEQLPDYYHIGLMVYYDVYDILAWGPFCSAGVAGGCNHHVAVERTGAAQIIVDQTGVDTVDLQIRKEGTTYTFRWREDETQPWHESGVYHTNAEPQSVGLFIKDWGPPPMDMIVSFDYFDLKAAEGEPPAFEPIPEMQEIPVGFPYARNLRTTGFPVPTLSVEEGPPGLTVEGNTIRGWTPGADDAGKSFTCRVKAENDSGSAEISWTIKVTGDLFADEFEETELKEGWTWHVPREGPTWDLEAVPGWIQLRVPQDNYDHWGNASRVSFDYMPRLVHELPTDGDFAIETRLEIETDDMGLADHLHTGLWLGFDSPVTDGILYGIYGNSNVDNLNPFPLLRGERTGHWDYNPGILRNPVLENRPVSVRLEKHANLYQFYYRYEDEDPWTHLQDIPLPYLVVKDVGIFIKNWDPLADYATDFDYFRIELLQPKPPVIELPDCGTPQVAYAGIEYTRRIPFTPGSPSDTTFTLKNAPAGMTFDETQQVVHWTPSAADVGKTFTVEIEAANSAGSASGGWKINVAASPAVWDDFEGPELEDEWEVFEPQIGAIAEFVDGFYRVDLPDGVSFDWWSNGNNWARQVRRSDMGDADFSIETRAVLSEETVSSHDEFHVGLMVYFEEFDAFIWGFYGAQLDQPVTGLQVERTGIGHMAVVPNESRDVHLRVTKDCENYDFYWKASESDPWNLAASFTSEKEVQYVGLVTKTWSADVRVDFDYFAILEGEGGPTEPLFKRGDANSDGALNIADAIFILGYLFGGGQTPLCADTADANDDSAVNIADAIAVLGHLFGGTGDLPPPFGACGPDPTADALPLCAYPPERCR